MCYLLAMVDADKAELKAKFLEYYRDVPFKKFGAMYIGVDRQTLYNWLKEDSTFSAQVKKIRSEFLQKNLKMIRKKEWIVERIFKDDFAERTEHTGPKGKPLPILGGMSKKDK